MKDSQKFMPRGMILIAALLASVPASLGINRAVNIYTESTSASSEAEPADLDPIIYNQARRRYNEFRDDFEDGSEFNQSIYPKSFPPDDADIEEMKNFIQRHEDGLSRKDSEKSTSSHMEIRMLDISYLFCGPCKRNNKIAEEALRKMSDTLRESGYDACIERDLVLSSISFDIDSKKMMGYGAVDDDHGESREISYSLLKEVMNGDNVVPQTIVYINGIPAANHIGPLKDLNILDCVKTAAKETTD